MQRWTDARKAFRASIEHLLWPHVMPWDVGRMKPTQIATVLGWDMEEDTSATARPTRAVPMEMRPLQPKPERPAGARPKTRLRTIVGGGHG